MTEYYSIQSSQYVIEHFGIKSMKWGPRRVVSSRGAARAQRKLTKLNKRMSESNSFINNYGANASMYGGRAAEYQRMARKAGLKG